MHFGREQSYLLLLHVALGRRDSEASPTEDGAGRSCVAHWFGTTQRRACGFELARILRTMAYEIASYST